MSSDDTELTRLREDAAALCADARLRALLRRQWPQLAASPQGRPLSLRIHPDDQMLLHSLRHHRDANAAVAQYYNVALQQYDAARQILDRLLPATQGTASVLDFACGFGRLLRFLSCCERELNISASEIQPDALRFVADEFGVPTLPSAMQPEQFEPGQRFDFIWVASLFSHLPESLFHRWLTRLHGLLTPRGVLCFSVHDEALVPAGQTLPASGLLFRADSENADLDREAYGTTYVSEAFVRAAIGRAAGPGAAAHRIRKGLAHEQDIYVVAASGRADLNELSGFRRGPWGWVDERSVEHGRLRLRGWAASIDDGALERVQIRVDERWHDVPTGLSRPDVHKVFADERLHQAGWLFEHELPADSRQPWVEVLARDAQGATALLYAGWPSGRPAAAHVYRRQIDLAQRSSLSVLASLVAPGSQVLDLGIGSGALGRTLAAQGSQVDGVTLNPAERDEAAPAYRRLEVLDLEVPGWEQSFVAQPYDHVICADVLEHLREPERLLRACQRLLKPGGWLLMSIPNAAYAGMVAELMHGNWNYGPEGLLDRTHLRFFTRRSFTRLLQAEGWQVERIEPIELTWYYTEFWTPFDQLPPAVARYLLAQPDASAYQLVFAARRADSPATAADARLRAAPVPASDPAIHVAVFATQLLVDDGQGRQRHLSALGRVGISPQTLVFDIPADALTAGAMPRLRWLVADRPGFLHLQALTLHDAGGAIGWHWQADGGDYRWLRQAPRRMVELGSRSGQGLGLLLGGDNPQLELPAAAGEALTRRPGPWRLTVTCGWPLSADYRSLWAAREQRAPEATVDIVLPVYGSPDLLRRCVASVLSARCQTRWHLNIIDDASPDPAIGPWLTELARAHPALTVLRNARNLGFVGTVNLGMRLAARRDVLLLNSDTEVADGWLDRLHRAAHRAPDVGTVTPFSNNATICSFPRFCEANDLPAGEDTASLQRLFARLHDGQSIDVPTAVGFCMYIRRDCLDDTGVFDAESFGAGYGEENDFCLRASARGWRHVHALDTFVRHVGGASFSNRQQQLQAQALAAMRRLHPQYEALVQAYVQRDPARPYREAVSAALAAAASSSAS